MTSAILQQMMQNMCWQGPPQQVPPQQGQPQQGPPQQGPGGRNGQGNGNRDIRPCPYCQGPHKNQDCDPDKYPKSHLFCYMCNVWGHDDLECFSTTKEKWEAAMHIRCKKAHENKTMVLDGGNLPYRGPQKRLPGSREGQYPNGTKFQGGTFTAWKPEHMVLRLKNQEAANTKFDAHLKLITDQYTDIVPYTLA